MRIDIGYPKKIYEDGVNISDNAGHMGRAYPVVGLGLGIDFRLWI